MLDPLDPVSREVRRVFARIERAERRVAMMNLSGKVKPGSQDPEKRTLRLVLGESSDGREVLSPPVRWQEAGAGGMKVHSQPADNEQMILVSASGTVGAGSIAVPATYDKDNEAPSTSSDTAVLERGGGRIELGPNGIELIGNVRARGGVLEHENRNVGHDHKHTDVMKGGDLTGPPQE